VTGVSDFGISGDAPSGPEPDLAARSRLADALRRLNVTAVASVLGEADLDAAAAEITALCDRLDAAAGPGRRPRRHPHHDDLPQDYFPTSPVVGLANPVAPPVRLETDGLELRGSGVFDIPYEGPPGCVHGGVIALVFDEILGAANILAGAPAMTGTLTVRYRRPTPLHTEVRLHAAYVGREGRKVTTKASMHVGDELTAEAEGIFIVLDPSRFLERMTRDGAPPPEELAAEMRAQHRGDRR
jgi:hypothetical protein